MESGAALYRLPAADEPDNPLADQG